jgi:hypothetical protein
MSTNAKSNQVQGALSIFTLPVVIDCSQLDADGVSGLTVACHPINAYLPAFHDVLNVDLIVETVGASDGSATVSFGFDDISSEPDNLLNDEAIASFAALTSTAGAYVAGIPRLGTDGTKVNTGITDAQLAYEIKTAALTTLKITALITLKPTR